MVINKYLAELLGTFILVVVGSLGILAVGGASRAAEIIAIADRAQQRLHRRYARLSARGKSHNVVIAAVGREPVGFLWAAMQRTEVRSA